ncbi:immunoglobulin domain-containing protein [archaeon]|nr:immunoglobulin domain-containing protein [archaeon]
MQPDVPVQETEVYGNLSHLQFESEPEEQQMKNLDECIESITDSSWRFVGYKEIGNFYEKRWCKGEGARSDCQITDSTIQRKDPHIITLNTFSYSGAGVPEVFGLGVHALKNPENAGWGVSFSFVENGKTITNEQSSITFSYFEAGFEKPQKSISLGSNPGYKVYETSVNLGMETPPREELEKFLASPESVRDHGLIKLNEHENEVYGHITSNTAVRCEYGPYEGGGIPPLCIERPLTEGEIGESLIGAQDYFSQKRSIITKDYKDMYTALMESFPFEGCWA